MTRAASFTVGVFSAEPLAGGEETGTFYPPPLPSFCRCCGAAVCYRQMNPPAHTHTSLHEAPAIHAHNTLTPRRNATKTLPFFLSL